MNLLLKLWVVVWLAEKKLSPFIYSTCSCLCVGCGEACWNFNVLFSSYCIPEAEFLDVIGTKVLRVFLVATVFTVTLLRDFNRSPNKSGLKLVCSENIVYGNHKSENSQDYARKP
jgi:hypothetical protein